jgi:DNA-binding protein Fis
MPRHSQINDLPLAPQRRLPQAVPVAIGGFIFGAPVYGPAGETLSGLTVEEVERELVLETLHRHRGNRTRAARALGISVRTLRNRIREYSALGIAVPAPLPRRAAGW